VHEYVEQRLRGLGRRGHRAVVAAVLRGHERVYACWCPRRERSDHTSLFEIGSVTKAFTGVLLADMMLAGEVAPEDPLSRHLPGPHPAWRHREPTLLELATHRSGLPNTPGPTHRRELAYALGLSGQDPWAGLTQTEYKRIVAAESPRRPPGKHVRYSSMAVGLLGDALAARAGSTYEDLLADRILRPLGMHRTSVRVSPELVGDRVTGHSRRGQLRPPIQDFMPAAGSLRSSAEDMLRFLSACLRPPAERPGPALALAQQPHMRLGRRAQIGLCWMISTRRNHPHVVWHNGGTWGFRSFAAFSPASNTATIVLSNSVRSIDRVGFQLLEAAATAPEDGDDSSPHQGDRPAFVPLAEPLRDAIRSRLRLSR
jgi:CubicO group peptidase (beta-lactamase class C family)